MRKSKRSEAAGIIFDTLKMAGVRFEHTENSVGTPTNIIISIKDNTKDRVIAKLRSRYNPIPR